MRNNRGNRFPTAQMFRVYRENLHNFFDDSQIVPDNLDMLDEEYTFYLIYDRPKQSIRIEDKDHIHPRSILLDDEFIHARLHKIAEKIKLSL